MNDATTGTDPVRRLGFAPDHVIQEYGFDSDVDDDLRGALEEVTGAEPEDEDFTGSTDAVLLWWRSDDGDLVDGIVDVMGNLVDGGFIVLCTPRDGRDGAVEAAEIDEAATTAGMHTSGRLPVGRHWTATRIVSRRTPRR